MDLVSQTPHPRSRGRPLFAEKLFAQTVCYKKDISACSLLSLKERREGSLREELRKVFAQTLLIGVGDWAVGLLPLNLIGASPR